jgi:O-antigen/teichoic acid export membrane protein
MVKKNILASFLIKGLSIIISLTLVPMTIHYVNPARYGIWLTMSSVISWFAFFDIGFGNGLRNKFAEAQAINDNALAKIYVSTTYAILSIIIGILLIVFFCINPILNWARILNAPNEIYKELSTLALVVFVFFCLQFILQLITTILIADQKPAKASFINILGSFLSLILVYILTKTTDGSLLYLGLVLGFSPVLILTITSFILYKGNYKIYSPSFKLIKFKYAKNLASLGLKFFVIQIAALVLFQTNSLIIAQILGPLEVTKYNIAFKYFGINTMITGIILTPFWSAFTEAWAKKDIPWIKDCIKKMQFVWVLLTVITIIMLLFSNLFYKLWIGNSVNISFMLSLSMALYVIITGWNYIFVQFLNGIGRIKLQLYSGIFGGIVNIPLSIYFGRMFGIPGVVLASCILGLINTSWTFVQYKKLINNNATGIWSK